ncbi:MAG TPA: protein translocase subunit SecD, partial [Burkholderiales bacterium]|nr:protein translocase subunit SecD [Burkholderiales bacterium]
MNRYPTWKYLLVLAAVVIALVYALPNLFGENPAIQISSVRGQTDIGTLKRVEEALQRAGLSFTGGLLDETGAKIRFADTETQLRARDVAQRELGDTYTVALNLLPATPSVLRAVRAEPMHLGLDLRGGVHFLMQVDTQAVLKKAAEIAAEDLRRTLREAKVRYAAVNRLESGAVDAVFRDAAERDKARDVVRKELRDLQVEERQRGNEFVLTMRISDAALLEKKRFALEQNMTALRNRVDELGV